MQVSMILPRTCVILVTITLTDDDFSL